MDTKVTLSFDAGVVKKARSFAAEQGISLSRFVEMLLRKATAGSYKSIEDIRVADWVAQVAEGPAEYSTKRRSRKSLKDEYFQSKK